MDDARGAPARFFLPGGQSVDQDWRDLNYGGLRVSWSEFLEWDYETRMGHLRWLVKVKAEEAKALRELRKR